MPGQDNGRYGQLPANTVGDERMAWRRTCAADGMSTRAKTEYRRQGRDKLGLLRGVHGHGGRRCRAWRGYVRTEAAWRGEELGGRALRVVQVDKTRQALLPLAAAR
jgi:hypothetical protein